MVFLIIFVVTLAASINIINHKVMIEFIYGAAAISLFTFILIIGQNGETRWWWSTVVITLVIIDCCVVNISQIKYRPFIDVLSEGQRIAEFLQFNSKDNRVYSPSYSLPQQTAAIYHLELADGIDPLQLTSYVDYMDTATGIPNLSYSVTLPPFSSGNPNTDNMYYQPNLKKLGMLNVQHIVSEYPLQSTFGMRLVKIIDGTWIYLNEFKYPRAWVQKEINGIFKTDTIISLSSSPNAIYIKADGPGLLVSSELYFPGWQVFVDGKKETIIPFEGVLRGVLLQRGRHEISFLFIPYPVYIGIFLSLCTTIFLIFITIKKKSNE
jgi:hypothetical protein